MMVIKRHIMTALAVCLLPQVTFGQPTQPEFAEDPERAALRVRAEQALDELNKAESDLAVQKEASEEDALRDPQTKGVAEPDSEAEELYPDAESSTEPLPDIEVQVSPQQPDVTILGDFPDPYDIDSVGEAEARLAAAQERYARVMQELEAWTWAAVYRAELKARLAEERRIRQIRRQHYRRYLAGRYWRRPCVERA